MNTIRTGQGPVVPVLLVLAAVLFGFSDVQAALFPKAGDRTVRMVVLGDSIMWGQGLREPDKMHSLVEDMLEACDGQLTVTRTVLAHSGAAIGVDLGAGDPGCAGEINLTFPTIMQQVDQFPGDKNLVDLVLVDGGINDVGLRTILSPFTAANEIEFATRRHCLTNMMILLEHITSNFTNARVVVCGYYQIVSEATSLFDLQAALIAFGVIIGGGVGGAEGAWAGTGLGVAGAFTVAAVQPFIVENCRVFAEASRLRLRSAVATVNATLGGTPRIHFADPRFERDEAIMAPRAKLFGISAVSLSWPNPILTPQDPVADWRRLACDDCDSVSVNAVYLNICYRASVGHPNEAGDRDYAHAILDALTTGGKGLVWADFSAPCASLENCGTGRFDSPWGLWPLAEAAVAEGGTVRIKASSEPGAWTLSKACVVEACGGSVTIGR